MTTEAWRKITQKYHGMPDNYYGEDDQPVGPETFLQWGKQWASQRPAVRTEQDSETRTPPCH
eukprot:8052133-Prorocentrum_lima.AAC.1